MRILITGKGGKPGSWAIRGVQIGDAVGATVAPMATEDVIRKHDIVVVVKRTPPNLIQRIRASGVPWVYDVVDPWAQPAGNRWEPDEARAWLRAHIASLKPRACIYTSPQQQADASWPGAVIHHHARFGQKSNPIRSEIRTIGYEGAAPYIERVIDSLRFRLRNIDIIINPEQLADLDVVLAMRGGVYDGYAPRHWKSNVKLANAQMTGTPVICANEAAYRDTASGAELWADTPTEALDALRALRSHETRVDIAQRLRAHGKRFALREIAARYREYLQSVL